jgi:pimeloyl-ACP methyl ester carboxylesterase
MERKIRNAIVALAGLSAALAAGAALVYRPYRRDIRAAYRRLQALEPRSIETPYGRLEYAVQGDGYPILLVHGNSGGFDQGLDLGAEHIGEGLMGISPSRFGYLGTPLPQGALPQMQADAFVYLLDELGVEQAGVMAWSAGGSSAVQLALRHPERVSALVLVSTAISGAGDAEEFVLPPESALRTFFRSDFLFWLLTNPFRSVTQRMFIPGSYALTDEDRAIVEDALEMILPVRPRAEGIVFDTLVSNIDPQRNRSAYPLEELEVPALIINARDDPLADYELAREMSERIPQSRFVTVEQGGHLMLGSGALVRDEVAAFLRDYADLPR